MGSDFNCSLLWLGSIKFVIDLTIRDLVLFTHKLENAMVKVNELNLL